jgi:hypothetical protein
MRYFLWLMPTPSEAQFWNGLIYRLARIYNNIPHLAHITLASWSKRPQLESEVQQWQALRLTLQPLDIGPKPWQSLYIPIEVNPKLDQMTTHYSPNKERKPHLSVLYGEHSDGRLLDLKQGLVLESKSVLFDQIALIQGNDKMTTWTEVKRWNLNLN